MSGLPKIITTGFAALQLIYFFTAGESWGFGGLAAGLGGAWGGLGAGLGRVLGRLDCGTTAPPPLPPPFQP